MSIHQTVVLVGGTGRTGQRTLQQLLNRGIYVRAIVRSRQKLSADVVRDPKLTIIEANLLALDDAELLQLLSGCDAVISCLGHVISLKGVFGAPRDLVVQATARLCRAIEAAQAAEPIKFILMSSVSVNRPSGLDTRRGVFERALLWVICRLVPPAHDNQRAADFLFEEIGSANASVQWVVIRPDTLLEGEVGAYTLHDGLVNSLFAPGSTNMANVAHLMCELVTDAEAWAEWRGKAPVLVNSPRLQD